MTTDIDAARARFDTAIAAATTGEEAFTALQDFARAVVGAKLFTVMTVDMENLLARRAFTSDPKNYPGSGTKPINFNSWFEIVHKQRRTFVANTIDEIANVFPDYELIDSLGCQSVVNLPVVLEGELAATVNMLDTANHYDAERVALIEREMSGPARQAVDLARRLG